MQPTSRSKNPKHCGKPMRRLYIRKGTQNRKWIPVGYQCSICSKMIRNVDATMHTRKEDMLTRPDLVDQVKNPEIIILDLGEEGTKVGFGGEVEHRFIFDSILYYDENNGSFIQKSNYIETRKTVKKQVTVFDNKDSSSLNLDALEGFLWHIFEALEVDPNNKSIVILEKNYKNNYVEFLYGRREEINNSTLPEKVREKLMEKKRTEFVDYEKYVNFPRRQLATLLFDSFKIARIYFSNGDLLSLYANKMVTGLVVNIGSKTTRVIPVYNGFMVTHAISVRDIGTKQVLEKITNYFDTEKTFSSISQHSKYLLMKRLRFAAEEYCYVVQDASSEENKWVNNEKLKKHIKIYDEEYLIFDQIRFLATEALFEHEELSTTRKKGTLVDAIIETVQKCDIDLVTTLYENILLTGGGTLYEGLETRIKAELTEKVPKHREFKIIVKPNRLVSSWLGGSILSSLKTFNKLWVTKDEYDAKGSSAVDRCI